MCNITFFFKGVFSEKISHHDLCVLFLWMKIGTPCSHSNSQCQRVIQWPQCWRKDSETIRTFFFVQEKDPCKMRIVADLSQSMTKALRWKATSFKGYAVSNSLPVNSRNPYLNCIVVSDHNGSCTTTGKIGAIVVMWQKHLSHNHKNLPKY